MQSPEQDATFVAASNLPVVAESSSHASPTLTANPKVAIPRQSSDTPPRTGRRVPRACESCRQRKTKCSGDFPVCRQCRELGVSCQYPVSWKEKTQKRLDQVSAKALDLENLVREIANVVDTRTSRRIRDLLEKHAIDSEPSGHTSRDQSTSNSADPGGDDPEGDVSSSSSIGSLEAIDRVDEDLNRTEESRATGYMGKNSEVTWMQRLRMEAEQRARKQPGPYESGVDNIQDEEFALHRANYHLDDVDVDVPGPVQTYWIPPRPLADQLFEDYLDTVHPFFPIISRVLFRAQYRNFFETAARPGDKWLAVLNMIFAIAAKHAHLRQAPWRGSEQDHLEYFTRARILSMDGDVLFSHPDLQQVQVEGLTAFYLLASDQINRAWRISALAVRSAITLGINLKSTSEATTNVSKEARYRMWWCLYSFEHMLGIMTGRPTCILDGIYTSPLPFPFEEEHMRNPMSTRLLNNPDLRHKLMENALASAYVRQMDTGPVRGKEPRYAIKDRDTAWLRDIPINQSLCFLYYIDLAVITQEIVNKVYSIDCVNLPWARIEDRISELRWRIDVWHASLPDAFNFSLKPDDGQDTLREKLFLAFYYYGARITLGRPCLCRHDARQKEPNRKDSFSHGIAVMTLESSLQMLDLIPDEPDAVQLYQICPWWCILHFLMQATTVLLLELSLENIHKPEGETRFLAGAKKAVRWLYAMSEYSMASRRAWQLCDRNLRRIASGMNYDITDIPSSMYEPRPSGGQATADFNIASSTMPTDTATITTTAGMAAPYTPADPAELPPQFNLSLLSGLPAASAEAGDAHFPYDSITGEFIRSFFPPANEEYPLEENMPDPDPQ